MIGTDSGQEQAKTFVIGNLAEGSEVAWLEHNPQTGLVKFFDAANKLIGERLVAPGERAWPTMDRYAEKYYSISPYAYALNNPVRYIDPTGDTVVLSGSQQAAAFQQLQDRLGGQLNMSMASNGTIIASPIEGVKQSRDARQAMKAFSSTSVTVNMVAENTKETPTGGVYIGGAFMGNTVNADGTVVANQLINPQVLDAMSNAYGKPGQGVLHEMTEAYQGGIISQRTGISSPMSNQPGSVYPQAHNLAIPQPGIITETYYDRLGNEVNTLGPSVTRATYTAYPRRQQPVIIMTFP